MELGFPLATDELDRERRRVSRALLYGALVAPIRVARADDAVWPPLQHGGHVALIRHGATTPGVGDPPTFKLDDCGTQRNLTDEGRAQALKVGEAFRAHSIPVERVLSSPWCRCIETARIAFDGKPETSVALSNLFARPENREKQVAGLRTLVSEFRGRGTLVLVSHGSTILALTGVSPDMAAMVVVQPQGSGNFAVVGTLNAS
jgi:broad specificity phosphatase PhoE